MCDYSLHGINNRLANENDHLVVHRFRTGSIGMAAEDTVRTVPETKSRWQWLFGPAVHTSRAAECAVCIPPGAALMLRDIPPRLQRELGLHEVEEVVFTQITAAANAYRDAVRFHNGAEVLLQRLDEGQRVDVISVSVPETAEAQPAAPENAFDEAWRSTNWV